MEESQVEQNSTSAQVVGPASKGIVGVQVTLPCGLLHKGERYLTADIKEMTGRVQRELTRPEYRRHPEKLYESVLQLSIVSIGGMPANAKLLSSLTFYDRDFLLHMIRKISLGDDIVFSAACPSCKEKIDVELDLNTFVCRMLDPEEVEIENDRYVFSFKDDEHSIQTFLPTGKDQQEIAKYLVKDPGMASLKLYARIVKLLDDEPVDFLKLDQMPYRTVQWITKTLNKHLSWGIDMSVTEACSECGENIELKLDPVAFFGL